MKDLSILYPVFSQVLLTLLLQGWMGYERVKSVRAKTVKFGAHAGERPMWPERTAVISNAFHNQLEMPVLFYVVTGFALIAGAADGVMLALAWAYAVSRLVHAAIHTTYNAVTHRFFAYAAGTAILLAMWARLAAHVMAAGV